MIVIKIILIFIVIFYLYSVLSNKTKEEFKNEYEKQPHWTCNEIPDWFSDKYIYSMAEDCWDLPKYREKRNNLVGEFFSTSNKKFNSKHCCRLGLESGPSKTCYLSGEDINESLTPICCHKPAFNDGNTKYSCQMNCHKGAFSNVPGCFKNKMEKNGIIEKVFSYPSSYHYTKDYLKNNLNKNIKGSCGILKPHPKVISKRRAHRDFKNCAEINWNNENNPDISTIICMDNPKYYKKEINNLENKTKEYKCKKKIEFMTPTKYNSKSFLKYCKCPTAKYVSENKLKRRLWVNDNGILKCQIFDEEVLDKNEDPTLTKNYYKNKWVDWNLYNKYIIHEEKEKNIN